MTNIRGAKAHRGKQISEADFRRMWADRSLSMGKIGAALGISEHAVRCRALARGLEPRGQAKQLRRLIRTDAEVEIFTSMWAFGVSYRAMTEYFGGGAKTVQKTVRRLGLPKRRHGGKTAGGLRTVAEWRDAQVADAMRASAEEAKRRADAQSDSDRKWLRRAA